MKKKLLILVLSLLAGCNLKAETKLEVSFSYKYGKECKSIDRMLVFQSDDFIFKIDLSNVTIILERCDLLEAAMHSDRSESPIYINAFIFYKENIMARSVFSIRECDLGKKVTAKNFLSGDYDSYEFDFSGKKISSGAFSIEPEVDDDFVCSLSITLHQIGE